jgi:hypothetical protein
MAPVRADRWQVLPIALITMLYSPGVTAWFYQDDFGWLNLRHDVHSVSDLATALFAPKAHGNMRPLGENAYWLTLSSIFGPDPLPFHIVTILTQVASLLLLGALVRRLMASELAALAAQVLWIVSIGVATALGWSSIYNQLLSAFFFLLAFYFLVRQRAVAHWIAFILGLGALEINVVYPALAAVYALLFARDQLKRILPMFAVSALAVVVHFHFAPPPSAGVYSPTLDARIFSTIWAYWSWALGPMPLGLTLFLTAAIALLVASRHRRLALLGLAWFAIPLLPYLPLPEHRMDYYLTVPCIGIALLGAAAVTEARWRVLTAACVLIYVGASLPAGWKVTRWQHVRGDRVEHLVLGVDRIHQSDPRKIILLEGIDTDLFWSGIADLPFRALSIPHVYLAPGQSASIQVAPDLLSKYVLPAALARRALDGGTAVVYRFDGRMLHRTESATFPPEDEPHLVNVADDVFQDYFGEGWRETPGGYRSMSGTATVRIGGPRLPGEHLYIGVFDTRPFRMSVRANGIDLPVELSHRDTDLSEFRTALPAAALQWKQMEVSLTADRSPLLFGYLEVR